MESNKVNLKDDGTLGVDNSNDIFLPKYARRERLPKEYKKNIPYLWRVGPNDPLYISMMQDACAAYAKDCYEKMGIRIIGDYDEMFIKVEIPDGWELRCRGPEYNYNWYDLFDNMGRSRANIGHYPDRYEALADFNTRYEYSWERVSPTMVRIYLTDNGTPIKTIKKLRVPIGDINYRELYYIAEKWLNKHYPKWQDTNAYWNRK